MSNIETGIGKPSEKSKGTKVGNVIEYGIQNPASSFDKRAEQGTVTYVGPSEMNNAGGLKGGNSQKKKHKSSGKGQ